MPYSPDQRARIEQAMLAGIANQQRKIAKGEVRDPRQPQRTRDPDATPTEYQAQKLVCEFLAAKGLEFFAVPNGGKRTAIEGNQLKYIGLRPGIPDLLILNAPPKHPTARGVALEMKRKDGGEPTEHQRKWLNTFAEQGWVSYCAHGSDDAIDFLRRLGW